jgi:hypothetical protein
MFASILIGVQAAPACLAAEPLRFELSDHYLKARSETLWYGLYLNKKKMGFVRWQLLDRGKEGGPVWALLIETTMKLKAFGKETETKEVEEWIFESRPPHRLRRATRTHSSGGKTLTVVRIEASCGIYTASIEEGTEKRKMDLDPLDSTLADVFAADIWVGKNPSKGDRIHYRTLSLSTLKGQVETAEFIDRKTVRIHGVDTAVSKVRIIAGEKGPVYTVRFDPLGRWLSASYAGDVESRLEPEEVARKVQTCHDLFTRGVVRIDKPLGIHPKEIKSLVLRVPLTAAKVIPKAWRQFIREEGGEAFLHLGAGAPKGVTATDSEIRECLAESMRYPLRHEKVKSLARKAVKGAVSDKEKVARLVAFVFNYIKKEYRFEPHSIFQIIELRRGDCSEHSYLFSVLARCVGIPSRVVDGLTYMGDKNLAFGGHAWNEVVLNGRWVQVDPTWNQTEVDATHILLKREGKGLGWETLGNVMFRVVRVKSK